VFPVFSFVPVLVYISLCLLTSLNPIQVHYSHVEDRERYDPAFILRFSIYSLSKAYIEPVEFAGSGLLAIAFVSMSSRDNGIRRLAYGTLDKFKNALEVGNRFISFCLFYLIKFNFGNVRFFFYILFKIYFFLYIINT